MTDEHPDLLALVQGRLDNRATLDAGDHLAACDGCREDLAELVTGNALLSRAGRTLEEPVRRTEPVLLPALEHPARTARPLRRAAIGLAAAAAVAVVAVVSVIATRDPAPPPSAAPPDVVAALRPVDGSPEAGARGSVSMVEGERATRMSISTDLPRPPAGQFYEAWLLDPDTFKMLPLGQLGTSGNGDFEVDASLVASYAAVDVSLEHDDGDPQHSVTSMLRGTYAP